MDRRASVRASRGVAPLALLAAWVLLSVGPIVAPVAAADTTRVVRGARVGPGGIEIEGDPDESGRERGAGRTSVRVGAGGVVFHAIDSDSDVVEVDIPGVHVRGPRVTVSDRSNAEVRAFSDIHVGPNEEIDGDVVAVFGSVSVEGKVSGDVVAVFGSVQLGPRAVVDGSAVAIGGMLDQADGSTVGDESVSLGFLPISFGFPNLPILLFSILVGWGMTVFMSWLLSLLFPDRIQRVATTASRSGASSFFLGIVSLPLTVVLTLLLFVTVIGIPIALLLPLCYGLIVWTGQIAATYLLGCRLMGRRVGEAAPFAPAAIGSLFVALFFVIGAVLGAPQGAIRTLALFFSLLGILLIMGLSILGTGAFLISRAGSRPREPRADVAPTAMSGAPVIAASPPPATG